MSARPARGNAFAPGGARLPVAVLGATGAVGQTFVRMLDGHPWFELAEVAASERSVGKTYAQAARWLEGAMPAAAASKTVLPCEPGAVRSPVVFSALDAAAAAAAEPAFARAGRVVLSNAKCYRMDDDVPLLIPEVNPGHLALLDGQRERRGWEGAIVTNANCSTIVLAMALAPLHEAFAVRAVFAATMQAVSGAGYPGVPSLDILGNVVPHILDEEGKIETETRKILGVLADGVVAPAGMRVTAHANRVAVEHGHTVCASVALERQVPLAEAWEAIAGWRGAPEARGLPSAPERPVALTDAPDRPQPRRDVHAGRGMTVTVGRLRPDPVLHFKLVAMGHNTVRGAAGASILNAELMAARGLLPRA
ncbi:MAG: aspartate-semialdehyde dehydrogenase [Gemmatimonadaceae bacterium]